MQGVLPWLPDWLYGIVHRVGRPHDPVRPWQPYASVNPSFAEAHGVSARARAHGRDERLRLQHDTRTARSKVLPRAYATSDGVMAGLQARFGLDIRDPTGDTRLAEFCLSLPEVQYSQHGVRRRLIRRAMADRVPAEILDNRRRGLQTSDWHAQLLRHQNRLVEEIARIGRSDLARRAIDLPRLRRLVDELPAVKPADPRALADYRFVLEYGLEVGRFILWAESAP